MLFINDYRQEPRFYYYFLLVTEIVYEELAFLIVCHSVVIFLVSMSDNNINGIH